MVIMVIMVIMVMIYNWLFLWDYTVYKWGLVLVTTGYFYGITHSINGD